MACLTSYSSYSCAHVPSSLQLIHTHSTRKRIHTPQASPYTPHTHTAHTRTCSRTSMETHASAHTARQTKGSGTYTEAHAHTHAHTPYVETGSDTLSKLRRYVFKHNVNKLSQVTRSDYRNCDKRREETISHLDKQRRVVHFVILRPLNSNIEPTGISTHKSRHVILKRQCPYNTERKHVNKTVW